MTQLKTRSKLCQFFSYLAYVDVRALCVNLWVVEGENSRVEAMGESNSVTGIVLRHDIGLLAVLALSTKAEYLSRQQVGALLVDLGVDDG